MEPNQNSPFFLWNHAFDHCKRGLIIGQLWQEGYLKKLPKKLVSGSMKNREVGRSRRLKQTEGLGKDDSFRPLAYSSEELYQNVLRDFGGHLSSRACEDGPEEKTLGRAAYFGRTQD
jgi:hypothetical protein